jgi:hypothetical protein
MGQASQNVGYPISLSTNVMKATFSKTTSITTYSINHIPNIIPRVFFCVVDERDDLSTITFEKNITKAAIKREVDSVVQSISFSQSWIIRSRHLPSCCSYKDSIAIAASDPKAPSSCLSQVSIAIYFNDSCIWFAPCLVLRRRIRMLLSVSIPRVGD